MSDHPAARQALAEAARNSDDPEMQIDAIHMLGTLDASAELQSLYPGLKSTEARVALIEALSMQGQTAMLIGYLESETNPDVRKAAINGLAMEGDSDSMAVIESMYDSSPNQEEKIAILESLMLMDDAEALALKILRTESDPELQRRAIQALGVMDATAALGEIYASVDNEDTRADVIEALVIADDAAGITNVLRVEKDPALRAQAIQALAIIDDELASGYVLELYPDGTREEKEAIIESMMIAENTQGLLGLLEQENDPELKREMLQMLTIIDSEESNEYLFRMLEKKD
jgi:HEAT repeat protein